MIYDYYNNPCYADKSFIQHVKPPSPELNKLCAEMAANPRFHISRENSFYPRGFPNHSPGWS